MPAYSVGDQQRQYRISLAFNRTVEYAGGRAFSNTIRVRVSCGPGWHCANEAVASQLGQLPTLNSAEQAAVQDLYFRAAARSSLRGISFSGLAKRRKAPHSGA